jgi:hypothetical protein
MEKMKKIERKTGGNKAKLPSYKKKKIILIFYLFDAAVTRV